MNEEHRKKSILITVLVAFLAVIIFLFWFFNLKNVMEANRLRSQGNNDAAKWQELKQEISDSLNDVNERLDNQEQKNQLKEDVKGLLNGVMEEAEKNTASSTATTTLPLDNPVASSTPSTDVKSNCPPYINCMPTIGEARPCQIPVGCEGITQIAY